MNFLEDLIMSFWKIIIFKLFKDFNISKNNVISVETAKVEFF